MLPEPQRIETVKYLEARILGDLDSGVFDDDDILSLIPPTRLITIVIKICEEIKNSLADRIEDTEENADLEIEPEDNFDDIKKFLIDMEILLSEDDQIYQLLHELENQVDEAIARVESRKQESDEEWDGEDIIPVKITERVSARSLFSDIDE